jgi:hypothetical protein
MQGTNGTLEIGPMQGTCQRSYKLFKKNKFNIYVTKITMKECMRGKKEMKEVYKQRKNERRVDKHTHTRRDKQTHTHTYIHNTRTQT